MEAAFLIGFREGLEAFLIMGLLLAFLQKSGLSHLKWIAWSALGVGVMGSLILAYLFSVVVDGFESEEIRYLVSLIILGFAVILLSYVIFWMHHQAHLEHLKAQITLSVNQKIAIFLTIFFAILREGLETALFLFALPRAGDKVFEGLIFGLGLAGVLVYLALQSTRNIPLRAFFLTSSYLLILIVTGLSALLVKGLQMAEYLPICVDPLFDMSAFIGNDSATGKILGAFMGYDATPSLLQFAIWLLYILICTTLLKRRNTHG